VQTFCCLMLYLMPTSRNHSLAILIHILTPKVGMSISLSCLLTTMYQLCNFLQQYQPVILLYGIATSICVSWHWHDMRWTALTSCTANYCTVVKQKLMMRLVILLLNFLQLQLPMFLPTDYSEEVVCRES